MTLFISGARLKLAVDTLGGSRAYPRLGDFLIFKRALVRTRDPGTQSNDAVSLSDLQQEAELESKEEITTGIGSLPFRHAVEEFTRCDPKGGFTGSPYFQPFGYITAKSRGYKTEKYPSNGPDNTAAGWLHRAAPLVELLPDTRPRQWRIPRRQREEYENFLLKVGERSLKPRLLDAACWWLRFAELDEDAADNDIIERFKTDLELTDDEIAGVFANDGEADASVQFELVQASPESYLPVAAPPRPPASDNAGVQPSESVLTEDVIESVITYLDDQGFVFQHWQVAGYITAIRTKPFVVLAGISGTGKTRLPVLVAEATGAVAKVVPVRPNWTDSSEIVGYERITGEWIPGELLSLAREAERNPETQYFLILDEINVARVEHYLAEVLSIIENRKMADGSIVSDPIAPRSAPEWSTTTFPPNLALVGSANMDETTHEFSKRVLDRSFVVEFAPAELSLVGSVNDDKKPIETWPVQRWRQAALTLPAHPGRESKVVANVIETLETLNEYLAPMQLQVGYRVRDEVAMFCLEAEPLKSFFVTRDQSPVNPLDLAITMKILPRIQGGGKSIQNLLDQLIAWSKRAGSGEEGFDMFGDRVELMRRRERDTGYASYWL